MMPSVECAATPDRFAYRQSVIISRVRAGLKIRFTDVTYIWEKTSHDTA